MFQLSQLSFNELVGIFGKLHNNLSLASYISKNSKHFMDHSFFLTNSDNLQFFEYISTFASEEWGRTYERIFGQVIFPWFLSSYCLWINGKRSQRWLDGGCFVKGDETKDRTHEETQIVEDNQVTSNSQGPEI